MGKLSALCLSLLLATVVASAQQDRHIDDAIRQKSGQAQQDRHINDREQRQSGSQKLRITQGPRVEYVGSDKAVIAWSTNVAASTVVRYGTDDDRLDERASAPWGSLTHRVTLRNLKPNTTYFFRVESGQAQGTGAEVAAAPRQFRTREPGQAADTHKDRHINDRP